MIWAYQSNQDIDEPPSMNGAHWRPNLSDMTEHRPSLPAHPRNLPLG
jgi:hypothetical protein